MFMSRNIATAPCATHRQLSFAERNERKQITIRHKLTMKRPLVSMDGSTYPSGCQTSVGKRQFIKLCTIGVMGGLIATPKSLHTSDPTPAPNTTSAIASFVV